MKLFYQIFLIVIFFIIQPLNLFVSLLLFGMLFFLFFNFTEFLLFLKLLYKSYTLREDEVMYPLTTLVACSEKSRREGLLSLEDDLITFDDPFLVKGMQCVIDGCDSELVKSIMSHQKRALLRPMKQMAGRFTLFLLSAALVSLLLLVIGGLDFIRTQRLSGSPATLLSQGICCIFIMAVLLLPSFSHLQNVLRFTEVYLDVNIEGVLSVQSGDNPPIVNEKLSALAGIPMFTKSGGKK